MHYGTIYVSKPGDQAVTIYESVCFLISNSMKKASVENKGLCKSKKHAFIFQSHPWMDTAEAPKYSNANSFWASGGFKS